MQEKQVITSIPYKKMMFHCLRYPTSKVIGNASCDSLGAVVREDSSKKIVDAFPLFHAGLTSPVLSLGLDLV